MSAAKHPRPEVEELAGAIEVVAYARGMDSEPAQERLRRAIAAFQDAVAGNGFGEHAVLTVDELAAILRVNRKTVYVAAGKGQIPGARRIGRSIRFHREATLRWLITGEGDASND